MNILKQDLGSPVVESMTIELNADDYELFRGLLRRFAGKPSLYVRSPARRQRARDILTSLGERIL